MANLTLTAYNSKYSNSSFADKRSMEHGLASSPLRLNREIAAFNRWGPEEMEARAQNLIERALKIWPYPGESQSSDTQYMAFDYCLADEPCDLSGTKLAGCEFLGQHYDVKNWAPLQRMLLTQLYQRNPERLRSWLTEKWGNFNVLAQFLKTTPDFSEAKSTPSAIFKLDEGMYLNSHQPVYDKVKMLKQLFELMEIDPEELTLHIVKMRNKD